MSENGRKKRKNAPEHDWRKKKKKKESRIGNLHDERQSITRNKFLCLHVVGCDEVVPPFPLILQELLCHLGANDVVPSVVLIGVAATVAEEASERGKGARDERVAEDVQGGRYGAGKACRKQRQENEERKDTRWEL